MQRLTLPCRADDRSHGTSQHKSSGATTVTCNEHSKNKFAWTTLGVVIGSATCTEGYGIDKHDRSVRECVDTV